ncbi:unnamed protein product [Linum trigynum]|uniref:Uncharacterized protein n=1 Tax=Linum trigynum TaxID=586398 RepID=A0AAV2EHT8_9ROSI
MARRSALVLATVLVATFLFSVTLVESTCDLREYGPPYPIENIADVFYRDVVSFALSVKNKERKPPHRMTLVSIDEGVFYPLSDYVSFYRFKITTSNHYGQAKYLVFVINEHPLHNSFTLKCFDRI